MSNKTARPFEVGDLVVLDNGSVGDVERYEPLMFPCPKIFVKTGIYTSVWIEVNNIKTIRKPRKGSKEARDIVAMLKWEYKNARYVTGDTDISGVLAEKAKSMLK